MKKILFISLAVVLALSVGLVGCGTAGPTAPTKIVVGLARDLEGPLAVFDWIAGGPVYRWFIDKVNTDGGIHLSAYDTETEETMVPVEALVRGFDVGSWDLGVVTEGLIEDADFIWGGPGTDCIYTQAPICNAAAKVLFTLEGGASDMIWDGDINNWPYVWVNLSFASWNEMPVLHAMLEAQPEITGRNATAYVVYIEAQHGYEYLQAAKDAFGEANVVGEVGMSYTGSQAEADTLIQNAITALNATPYDVFIGAAYPDHVTYLTKAMITYDFNPPAIILGPGANFGYYCYDYPTKEAPNPALVEGIMCYATANNKTVPIGTPTMSMADMFNALAAQLDKDVTSGACKIPAPGWALLDYWGHPLYTAAVEMWKYCVEKVGRIDNQAAIRSALASFNSTNPAQTVLGDTWYTVFPTSGPSAGYGGGVLDYKCHTGEIGQWQSAYVEIVGYAGINAELPNYDVTADFKFPMTDQWGWLAP